jgi:hypothetical protein
MPLSLKQQISRYYDLRSLHDRGWSDQQLGRFAGITAAEARAIIDGEPPSASSPEAPPPAAKPKGRTRSR